MSAVAEVQHQALSAFDGIAATYDDLFTRSLIGRAQRGAVWEVLIDTFEPGAHILELNCGTGEDALFLARHEVYVTACDGSEGMIHRARQRLQAEDPDAPVEFKLLATEHLARLQPAERFDGALSNFSGLNCVANLNQVARDLASVITARAPVVICLSTRYCLAEMFWFLLHGDLRKAMRRTSGTATAGVGKFVVKVYYPTLREVTQAFSPWFRLQSCTGIGVTVPPSYVEPVIRKHPRLLRLLCFIDRHVARLPWVRTLGDHMLLHFVREGGRC